MKEGIEKRELLNMLKPHADDCGVAFGIKLGSEVIAIEILDIPTPAGKRDVEVRCESDRLSELFQELEDTKKELSKSESRCLSLSTKLEAIQERLAKEPEAALVSEIRDLIANNETAVAA